MGSSIWLFLLCCLVQIYITAATTDSSDSTALRSLVDEWKNLPPGWLRGDPCRDNWVGIECTGSRITSIILPNMNLEGELSGDISILSELQQLDLSYNGNITGPLPLTIGNLKKLTNLILVGCGFTGPIPYTIGSLPLLNFLSLNSNGFTGNIPPSIGNLSSLLWLDLADNKLEGPIPISNGSTPGLDMLTHTKHFHFGKNKLSGQIPSELFSSNMSLIHLLFESNRFSGILPPTLGLVQTLEVIRLDNNSLSGELPSNLNNLTRVHQLFLSNNRLTGPLPNLTGMSTLNTLYLSNNSFDASDFPSWLLSLSSLTVLMMEGTKLQGQVPATFFNLPNLQTVVLKRNQLNGTLTNGISDFNGIETYSFAIILVDNPVCLETGKTDAYCKPPPSTSLYSTPLKNCPPSPCSSGQTLSPTCRCAHPYTGTLQFRSTTFFDTGNSNPYETLEQSLIEFFQSHQLPVETVSLSDPRMDSSQYLLLNLDVFPYGQDSFNRSAISMLGYVFSNQTFKPPSKYFGPYVFNGDKYEYFSDAPGNSKNSSNVIKIGLAAGASVLFLLLMLAGVLVYLQKKKADRATKRSNPFAHWDSSKASGSIPQLKGARCFSFEELKKYTNNFSEACDIGSGGYGKVYRGTLPTGELVAIKRAQQGSMQGGLEFKTEIELLSRVHHKNVVSLLGFCFDRDEQILIYEYVANGSLGDSLSGKSGIKLDWTRRLKVALGSARGLAYLHELANPPIIHRDVKSSNILLDERLNAKVADFGLSKLMGDSEKGHVTTQVKGTMGYLDPEYYMTQQLTEKSDVYSFGVVMLEMLTARKPIEHGKYVVREVARLMDKTKSLYNLQEILDPTIGWDSNAFNGLEKYVDLALSCVEESRADRPAMGEVVKEIENIMQMAGLNPHAESASSSSTYEDSSKGSSHPTVGANNSSEALQGSEIEHPSTLNAVSFASLLCFMSIELRNSLFSTGGSALPVPVAFLENKAWNSS
ncbi:hypothetical protein V6N12_073944 [Hibiscus sabdariffa]|uniref:Protein kinase domain-containing protein n=1 Tax=Hibiscus sabdariffa TaxID=183260 RepID=A0ABR1Z801_9ROSI